MSRSGFSRRSSHNNNKHHLETDISCPGCNMVFEKNTPFDIVLIHRIKGQGACGFVFEYWGE